METGHRQSPLVLVVEDNPNDMFLLQVAAREICPDISFVFQPSGRAALEYLQHDGAPHTLPDLVLLDCKLPDMNGLAVLHSLRSTPGFDQLKILLWTDEPDYKTPGFQAGANGFVAKTVSFTDQMEALRCVALDARAAVA